MMQPLSDSLSAADMALIRDCLRAMVEGPFVPDWEFETVVGVRRTTMRKVLRAWPVQTVGDSAFECAIVGALNNLTGYPHRQHQALVRYVPASVDEILWALDRVLAVIRPGEIHAPWVPITQSLAAADVNVVHDALMAATSGPFFDDQAFETLFGMDRLQVEQMQERWPAQTLLDVNVAYAVGRSLSLLIELPAEQDRALAMWAPVGREAMAATLERVIAVAPDWRIARERLVRGPPGIAAALEPDDLELIRICLRAAVEGGALSDDEFRTLTSFDRWQMRAMLDAWPAQTERDLDFAYVAGEVLVYWIERAANDGASAAPAEAAALQATLGRLLDVFNAMTMAGTLR